MDKEILEKKLADITGQEQIAIYNVQRLQGAKAILLQLLEEESEPEPAKKKPASSRGKDK